ncbi:MAG: hypothetical protein UFX20_04410 [Longibaculum muris]|uniref:nuclear transport factor 2 family protein n=1 Tax=Longibaculum muris TaxID=1796628 RepID=UPI002E789B98|nr:nuclear transport factor 2 family protein [Longibaculum muris]MED9811329.1 hypothetical protein [Longibaculum muris]
MQKEEIIKNYFQSWLDKDIEPLKNIFSNDISYSECYGPEYHGLLQILKWFIDWNKKGTVLKWEIKKFIHQDMITVVEWYFECNYNNEIGAFNGVSIIEFDKNMRIINVKEFQSKKEHIYPYE